MIKKATKLLSILLLSSVVISQNNALAEASSSIDLNGGNTTSSNLTTDNNIFKTIFTDFCWGCVFPIRVAGIEISGVGSTRSTYTPSAAASRKPICMCKDAFGVNMPGFSSGMWEPARMIELVKKPGKLAVFGGVDSGLEKAAAKVPKFGRMLSYGTLGDGGVEQDTESDHYMHYHYFAFPALVMFEMYINKGCSSDGIVDFDIMFLSEFDPTWNNPAFAFFASPMAALFANPLAIVACIPDAIASAGTDVIGGFQPIDELFWCAGSWGGVYPANGVTAGSTAYTATSNLVARALTSLHTRGQAMKTMGKKAQCKFEFYPVLPKSQYGFTTLRPFAEKRKKHYVGQTELEWSLSKNIPTNEYIYAIWRWRDCCAKP